MIASLPPPSFDANCVSHSNLLVSCVYNENHMVGIPPDQESLRFSPLTEQKVIVNGELTVRLDMLPGGITIDCANGIAEDPVIDHADVVSEYTLYIKCNNDSKVYKVRIR